MVTFYNFALKMETSLLKGWLKDDFAQRMVKSSMVGDIFILGENNFKNIQCKKKKKNLNVQNLQKKTKISQTKSKVRSGPILGEKKKLT